MHKIRMIGLDLDGTLLRKDQTISEENIKILQECIQKNIQVYIISGRPYCFSKMIAERICSEVKVISSNGAIYEIGKTCIENTIKPRVLYDIIDVLKNNEHAHAFFKGKEEFFTRETYDKRFLYDHVAEQFPKDVHVKSYTNLTYDELKQKVHNIAKILVYDMNAHRLADTRKQIECIDGVTLTSYQPISFDITASGVHKGNAIKEVLQELGLKKEEFMAIGDAQNDIPMFEEAGMSVAMGNASDEIKAYCDMITSDYMEDGVAKAIRQVIQ